MDDMKWKVLASSYIYRDDWFTARRDRCQTPGGVIVEPYYVLEFPDWVNAVALTAEGQLLLIRQYRHALGQTLLEIPGGCMDATDADPEAAMRRELLEETGYAFDRVESLGIISPNPSTNSNLTHMFLATGGRRIQEQELDANEEITVHLLSPSEAVRLLEEHGFMQSLHATCLFYAFRRLGWMTLSAPDP